MIYQSYSLSSACICAGAYCDNVTMWRCDNWRFSGGVAYVQELIVTMWQCDVVTKGGSRGALHMCRSLLWQCDNVTLWHLACPWTPVNRWKLCFCIRKAMLSDVESYAFGCLELCFRTRKGMPSEAKSDAFDVQKQCSSAYGAMF